MDSTSSSAVGANTYNLKVPAAAASLQRLGSGGGANTYNLQVLAAAASLERRGSGSSSELDATDSDGGHVGVGAAGKLPSSNSKFKGAATTTTRPSSAPFPARELLFQKTVTRSDVDVGKNKSNRLVIPKQHAEKLPAAGGDVLDFEDADGKVWHFRYTYYNSSHSYVLTKGWKNFVKVKGLHTGDIIGFYRSAAGSKLFIECC